MKNRFTRFIRGAVTARVVSGSEPRFITAAMRAGFRVLSAKNGEFTVLARDYKRLRPIARGCGCVLRVKKRHGIFFELNKRALLLPLLALTAGFAACYIFLCGRVMAVKVSPSESVPRAELIECLAENGVYFGARRDSVEMNRVRQSVLLRFPSLSYAVVNLFPGYAELTVNERTYPPQSEISPKNALIVSRYDAVVTDVNITAGTPTVQPGQVVMAGELLARSGVTPFSGSWTEGAAGSITGIASLEIGLWMPDRIETLIPSGERVEKRYLQVGELSIPLDFNGVPDNAAVTSRFSRPALFSVELPAAIRTDCYAGATAVFTDITKENIDFFAKQAVQKYIESNLTGAKLYSVELSCEPLNGGYKINARITAELEIGRLLLP